MPKHYRLRNRKQITVSLSDDLLAGIRAQALAEGINKSECARRAFESYIYDHAKDKLTCKAITTTTTAPSP